MKCMDKIIRKSFLTLLCTEIKVNILFLLSKIHLKPTFPSTFGTFSKGFSWFRATKRWSKRIRKIDTFYKPNSFRNFWTPPVPATCRSRKRSRPSINTARERERSPPSPPRPGPSRTPITHKTIVVSPLYLSEKRRPLCDISSVCACPCLGRRRTREAGWSFLRTYALKGKGRWFENVTLPAFFFCREILFNEGVYHHYQEWKDFEQFIVGRWAENVVWSLC